MIDDDWMTTAKILGRERDEALAKLDAINEAIAPHVGYQASKRGALARQVGRITGSWTSSWGADRDREILESP